MIRSASTLAVQAVWAVISLKLCSYRVIDSSLQPAIRATSKIWWRSTAIRFAPLLSTRRMFEQLSGERFKALVDTNFYGVADVSRAMLPIMRKQKSGHIP